MEEVLTETEIRTMYEKRQAEPFPVRKSWMGIILALIILLGTIGLWGLLLWGLMLLAR